MSQLFFIYFPEHFYFHLFNDYRSEFYYCQSQFVIAPLFSDVIDEEQLSFLFVLFDVFYYFKRSVRYIARRRYTISYSGRSCTTTRVVATIVAARADDVGYLYISRSSIFVGR